MTSVLKVFDSPPQHWVGDGFPVSSLFSYQVLAKEMSPFLLLDRAGPTEFTPSAKPRGVHQHPHRGFETVTIVYSGEVAHRDSTGQGGSIGPGDVQWMTAASGILHEEFHSEKFTRSGGTLDMVQLWVNLAAKDKKAAPGYQTIKSEQIPEIDLSGNAGSIRVIAGEFQGQVGPARTFSPMQVWDIRLNSGGSAELPVTRGWNSAIVVLHGTIGISDEQLSENQMALLDSNGGSINLVAETNAIALLLSGQPIYEPVVGQGPFVMNTQEEIAQSVQDFRNGRFGQISH